MSRAACCLLAVILFATQAAADPPRVEQYLTSGELAAGEEALVRALAERGNQQDRFGLGVLRFARAIERLSQSFYRHGLRSELDGNRVPIANLPFLRLPLPENPRPEPLTYPQLRKIFERFIADLAAAEETLVPLGSASEVKLPLHFGRIKLDLNGDGKADEDEKLWRLYARMNAAVRIVPQRDIDEFVICFDKADVFWLRGYCHLLMAMSETLLAHDFSAPFDALAPYAFAGVKSNDRTLKFDVSRTGFDGIVDAIAAIHILRFPVVEPARTAAALAHLQDVIELSRKTWQAILAETDNDFEWIPGPGQTGVMPGVRVTKEMVTGWHEFLDEAEALLRGRKLVPQFFERWTGRETNKGINLRRVFTQPRDFDAILWIQGSGVAPFVEEGQVTSNETWNRFERIFGGQFIGFAFWFN